MIRWPSSGSSPVVSVSRTISRTAIFLKPALVQLGDDLLHLVKGVVQSPAGLNHKMRFCTLCCIRHLVGENVIKLVRGHLGAGQHACPLKFLGRRYDNDSIHTLISARFKE